MNTVQKIILSILHASLRARKESARIPTQRVINFVPDKIKQRATVKNILESEPYRILPLTAENSRRSTLSNAEDVQSNGCNGANGVRYV